METQRTGSEQTDADMVRQAAELVRRGWTTGYAARAENGAAVNFYDRKAVCFCTIGALQRAVLDGLGGEEEIMYTDFYEETYSRVQDTVLNTLSSIFPNWKRSRPLLTPYCALGDWNDQSADQNTVVALLEKAATLAAQNQPPG